MKTVVFDIETVSLPWLDLDPMLREKLTRYAEDHDDFLRRKKGGALSPYTGKVVVIGMLNPESGRGSLWHEGGGPRTSAPSGDQLFDVVACDEKTMLEEFWRTLTRFDRVVSFNGRRFDGPFLSVRSAVHGLKPSRNLAGYRYSIEEHLDLLEALTFFGTTSWDQTPTLHAACTAFGVPSPKSEEIHGYAVDDFYRKGRIGEIAGYCRRDVEATAELFRRLEPTLLPLFRK
ncbi:MAG: ribonuclease H-like domain-containing protein [Acidithiobacillales bacterium]